MQEQIKKHIKFLTTSSLYHSDKIIEEELKLEMLIHNDPAYQDILAITKEMNAIATAVNSLELTARMAASLKFESKQRELKEKLDEMR